MTILPTEPRFTGGIRLAGTRSFRHASGKMFDRYGSNVQNPDKDSLDICVARPGMSFVQADQAGAEALVVAYLARPGNYRRLFEVGIKPHTFLAMHIFGEKYATRWPFAYPVPDYLRMTPDELVTSTGWKALDRAIKSSDANPDKPYFIGKKTAHGKSYKMGAVTYQKSVLKESGGSLVLTIREAKAFMAKFDELFPEIIEWQGELVAEAKAARILYNLFGYPRRCERIFTDSYDRELISWKPQSTVGIITALAEEAAQTHIEASNLDWNLLNNKHDSFLLEVPDDAAPDAAALMSSWLAVDFTGRDGVRFTMKSEVQIGKNWKPFHEVKNPLGMKEIKL